MTPETAAQLATDWARSADKLLAYARIASRIAPASPTPSTST